MSTDDGIIEVERNPFAQESWAKQTKKFTRHRSEQVEEYKLIGSTVEEINSIKNQNKGAYPAFVAIRWGFLKIENNRLVTTHKWDDRELYFNKPSKPKPTMSKSIPARASKPRPQHFQHSASELQDLDSIRSELERRRSILIERAHDDSIRMDRVEREHIIEYLEKENLPQKPSTEVRLLKEFVSSAMSINQPPFRTRSRLKKILGEIVLGETIALCLSRLFESDTFLDDENWKPDALQLLVTKLRDEIRDEFGLYVVNTIDAIAVEMKGELVSGLSKFYARVEAGTKNGPERAWAFMQDFTTGIPGVGPVLMSDFLKNVGFPNFVKIDFHLKREFPSLLSGVKTDARSLFIHAWHLCEELEMTPFIFDHIMYQWGRSKL